MSDIDRTVRALVASLDEAPLPCSGNELSPILSVLTVILSLDRRRPGYVEERIKRLQSPDPGYGTLAGIRAYAALLTPEKYFPVEARDGGKRADLLLPLRWTLLSTGCGTSPGPRKQSGRRSGRRRRGPRTGRSDSFAVSA